MSVKASIAALKSAVSDSERVCDYDGIILIARSIFCFVSGFLLSSARIMGVSAPFGIAAVAAAGAGLNGVSCVLGAFIGYIVSGGIGWGIRYLAAIVIVYTLMFSFQDTRIINKKFFAPAVAASVALTTGILAGFSQILSDLPNIGTVLLETVIAFGACLFFREAIENREAVSETAEARHNVSVMLTVSVYLMALSRAVLFETLSVGRFLSQLLLMAFALKGGIQTACPLGAVLGAGMDLSTGGVPFFTMAYTFSGLVAGTQNRNGRLAFVIAFSLANAVAAACVWANATQIPALVETFCASVVFMLLPSSFISKVTSSVHTVTTGNGESGLRRYVSRRIENLSLAYSGLFEMLRRNIIEPHNDADPACVFDRAADSVCSKCGEKNRCWNSEYTATLSALNDATAKMQERGILQIGDIPDYFTKKCRNPEAFVTACNGELRAVAYRKHFAARLRESRDTAWGQYSDMADILKGVADEIKSANGADRLAERRLVRYLLSLDIEAETSVFRDSRGRLHVIIEGGSVSKLKSEENYLSKLSEVLGLRLCKPKTSTEASARLTLVEAEPLSVSVGIAAMKKKGERVSGDRGTYFKTDGGVLCVILSDGMGCGKDAARDSREVLDILEKFLRSGMDPSVAMKTLNSVMLLKSGDNWGFATVDLMCVDLFSGETCFYKYGAAPSYVLSGNKIRRINCRSFAPGLNDTNSGAPDVVRMRLKAGSTAIIASDGVVGDTDDSWLLEVLDSSGDDMKLLARDTLREAAKQYGGCDDMTVLAVRVLNRA